MSLGAVAARRLLLRRGAGALAALFVATPRLDPGSSAVNGIGGGYGQPITNSATDDGGYKQRSLLAKPLTMERDRHWRRKHIRSQAWHNQDPDLMVLRSTSQAWRASVMRERLNGEASVMDTLEQRLSAIWEEPLAKVQGLVAQWIKGTISP